MQLAGSRFIISCLLLLQGVSRCNIVEQQALPVNAREKAIRRNDVSGVLITHYEISSVFYVSYTFHICARKLLLEQGTQH